MEIRVCKYKNDAQAAYSIVHDDLGSYGMDELFDFALPTASRMGIPLGLACIANSFGYENERNVWLKNQLQPFLQSNEIISHSYSHLKIDKEDLFEKEIWSSQYFLNLHFPKNKINFFTFPFDYTTTEAIEYTKKHYIACRGGNTSETSVNLSPDFVINHAVFGNGTDHPNAKVAVMTALNNQVPHNSLMILNDYVKYCLVTESWGVRELHNVSVNNIGWGNCHPNIYKSHLRFIQTLSKKKKLWIDTPTNIYRYIKTRDCINDLIIDEYNIRDIKFHLNNYYKYHVPIHIIIGNEIIEIDPFLMG